MEGRLPGELRIYLRDATRQSRKTTITLSHLLATSRAAQSFGTHGHSGVDRYLGKSMADCGADMEEAR